MSAFVRRLRLAFSLDGILRFVFGCGVFGLVLHAHGGGLADLQAFLQQTQSGRAEFTQQVSLPLKVGEAQARKRNSSGLFEFARPNRFQFIYRKPFEQTLVSDGQTLWLYDADLHQVSSRKLSQAINGTPAVLITSGADMKAIEAEYQLSEQAEHDGQTWVRALPRNKESTLQSIEMGFRRTGVDGRMSVELASLKIADGLGQQSVLSFRPFTLNLKFGKDHFRFTPPAGADVIR